MPTAFPDGNDNFKAPTSPTTTTLSSAGDSTRNHPQSHQDLGDAIMAIQQKVSLLTHDHSGQGARATNKLVQANTHESADTDAGANSLHHTLGSSQYQAARGNHTHLAQPIGTFSSSSPNVSLGQGSGAAVFFTLNITVPAAITNTRLLTIGWINLFPTPGGGVAGSRTYNTGIISFELIDSSSNSLYADSNPMYGWVQDDGSGSGYFPTTVPFSRLWPVTVGPGTYRLRFQGYRSFANCGVSAYSLACSTTFLDPSSS